MGLFERLDVMRRRILLLTVTTGLSLIAFILGLVFLNHSRYSLIGVYGGVAVMVASMIFLAVQASRYKKLFKEELVQELLSDTFDDVIYRAKDGIPKATVAGTEMITMGNVYQVSDYVEGRYRGLRFRQSDVAVRLTVYVGKTTVCTTFFEGRWMIFEFDKNFGCRLWIREKDRSRLQRRQKGKKAMLPLTVDDEAFNRFFQVCTDDAEQASYILTPSMRETILQVNDKLKSNLMFYFCENTLHVAIHGIKDAFEIPMFRKTDWKSLKQSVLADIGVITAFADQLLSDSSLFDSSE